MGIGTLLLLSSLVTAQAARIKPNGSPADSAIANNPKLTSTVGPGAKGSAVLRAQILLDRANYSSGEIDGSYGKNLRNTIKAFQKKHALPENGVIAPETWRVLNMDAEPVLISYTIVEEDTAGPFEKIPEDMQAKSKLKALGYESALEGLAEKFHCSPQALTALNRGKRFNKPGETILAPNVETKPAQKASKILVDASDNSVSAVSADGSVIAHFPATTGSEHDPLPAGTWKILGVSKLPVFHYNPKLFWDADNSEEHAEIAPGPNNPVGVVWISLSKPHYGIHGTPEPGKIGYTQSHGCIRLTNWDAAKLAEMVKAGTPAVLTE